MKDINVNGTHLNLRRFADDDIVSLNRKPVELFVRSEIIGQKRLV